MAADDPTFLESLGDDERRSLLKHHAHAEMSEAFPHTSSPQRPGVGPGVGRHHGRHQVGKVVAQHARARALEEQKFNPRGGMGGGVNEGGDGPTWEIARLRVQTTSLAAENDALRSHSLQLAQQLHLREREASAASESTALEARQQDAQTAEVVAGLEDVTERQRRGLSELALAAEALANDNLLLSRELDSAKLRARSEAERVSALEDRLAKLQELYIHGIEEAESGVGASMRVRSVAEERFWLEIATPEVLSVSRPPANFPVPKVEPTWAAKHIGEVRRQRDALQAEVHALEGQLDQISRAHSALQAKQAAERRAAADAARKHQGALMGAVRRIQWLVTREKQREEGHNSKDAYIARLEQRLLEQFRMLSHQHLAQVGMRKPPAAAALKGPGPRLARSSAPSGAGPAAGRGAGGKARPAGVAWRPLPKKLRERGMEADVRSSAESASGGGFDPGAAAWREGGMVGRAHRVPAAPPAADDEREGTGEPEEGVGGGWGGPGSDEGVDGPDHVRLSLEALRAELGPSVGEGLGAGVPDLLSESDPGAAGAIDAPTAAGGGSEGGAEGEAAAMEVDAGAGAGGGEGGPPRLLSPLVARAEAAAGASPGAGAGRGAGPDHFSLDEIERFTLKLQAMHVRTVQELDAAGASLEQGGLGR